MKTLLTGALKALLGSAVGPVRSKVELPDLAGLGSPPVFSLSPSHELTSTLREKGYTHVHSFAAIPSQTMPRWLLPTGDSCALLAGAHIYQPYKWTARVIKSALIGMMKMGWYGWWDSPVLVASRGTSSVEALVRAVTGEDDPLFALSLGRQAAVRKLTIQVMRRSGDILGYMKLPLTDAAAERVRKEAGVLDRLWNFPAIRPHIPRILYAGKWNGTYVLFQSALEGERGPVGFNEMHQQLLKTLRNVHWAEMPGQALTGKLAAKWQKAVRHLGGEWEGLGQEVLRRSTRDLYGKVLRCGVMHGDFAPWNTRVRNNTLLLFDWESADWDAPISWDVFHFQVQTSHLLSKHKGLKASPAPERSDETLFMLYVLSSVCGFLEEENQSGISHHKKLLIGQLQGRRAPSVGPASMV